MSHLEPSVSNLFNSQRREYAVTSSLRGQKGELRNEWERAKPGGVVRYRAARPTGAAAHQ
jgi:hypothetical protein